LIVTSRLELRPFRPDDAAELHEVFSDPETHTIGGGPPVLTRGDRPLRAGRQDKFVKSTKAPLRR